MHHDDDIFRPQFKAKHESYLKLADRTLYRYYARCGSNAWEWLRATLKACATAKDFEDSRWLFDFVGSFDAKLRPDEVKFSYERHRPHGLPVEPQGGAEQCDWTVSVCRVHMRMEWGCVAGGRYFATHFTDREILELTGYRRGDRMWGGTAGLWGIAAEVTRRALLDYKQTKRKEYQQCR